MWTRQIIIIIIIIIIIMIIVIMIIIIIIIKHEKLNFAEMASESWYQTFYQLKGEMIDHHNLSRLIVTS